VSRSRIIVISKFEPVGGHCFLATLPDWVPDGDTLENPFSSAAVLLENDTSLGPPHAQHLLIGQRGGGAYSHWYRSLYASASDNSDPRSNGRQYQLYLPPAGQHSSKIQRATQVLLSLPDAFGSSESYAAVERCLSILYPEAKIGEDQKLFWNDHEFLDTYQRLCGDAYRSLERKYSAYSLAKSVLWAGGDIAECGAYNGATAHFLALAIRQENEERHLYLFDSFEGLSEPGPHDSSYWHAGSLAVDEAICRQNLSEFGNVHFLRGWIPDRFAEVAERSFCFVHVDVDLYEPTRASIEFFYERLVPGGMLLCDDYGFVTCPGATRAMEDFFADKPERIVHLATGQGLVTKR
jgi:hypothetical protein